MNATTKLLVLGVATLAVLAGAIPAAATTSVAVGGGGGDRAVGGYATAPGTGPQAGEIAIGSLTGSTRSTAGRHGAATGLKANPTCAVQCITSGIAYGRGPDARLVVTTDTPATIRIVVSRAGYYRMISSPAGATSLSADFDDLEADTHYDGFVSAVDANGAIATRSGSFTTLERNVVARFSQALVTDLPHQNGAFGQEIWFEGQSIDGSYGEHVEDGVLLLGIYAPEDTDTDRYLELEVELANHEDTDDVCEAHWSDTGPEFGQFDCDYTAYAELPGGSLDLDDRPWISEWNSYEIVTELVLATDYYSPLVFTVPVTVEVTWTP